MENIAVTTTNYYKMLETICVSRECEWNSRVEVSEGGQPLRQPGKSDAVVIPVNISGGLFHLLRADPNVVLSLKTEATAPHYRLSVCASILPVFLWLRFSFALLHDEKRLRLGGSRFNPRILYPRSFLNTPLRSIPLSLSPSPDRAQSAL